MKKVNQYRLEELVSPFIGSDGVKQSRSFIAYDLRFAQDTNELCRLIPLYPFFKEPELFNSLEYNPFHGTADFKLDPSSKTTPKELAKMIFQSLYDNLHVIITANSIRTTAKWVDETYDEYWLRSRWELADYIGLDISSGWGHTVSTYPTSKYYRGNKFKTEDKNGQLNIPLD